MNADMKKGYRIKMKKLKLKNVHIAIIVLGIILNCIGIFQSNLWFDEAYSVALASKTFKEIWIIGGHDVHPVLYYWVLHLIYLLMNNFGATMQVTVIAYRVFSMVCLSLLSVLGYTHIKRDFGEKVGVLFSFFALFLPTICVYASEVRMYSLAILLVTILAIYAYRLAKFGNMEKPADDIEVRKTHSEIIEDRVKIKNTRKNWTIFIITSLLCIYTHYYALMAAGIINCMLLANLVRQKRKSEITTIVVAGIAQAIAYIPWLMCFIGQISHVSRGFWIKFEFPNTIMQLASSQFIGKAMYGVGFFASIVIYGYLFYKLYNAKKNKEEYRPALYAVLIYLAVIVAALIIRLIMKTSILYYRYLFAITGLYIFFIAYTLGKEKNKYIMTAVIGVTVVLSIWSNCNQLKEVYDASNNAPMSFVKERIQPGDDIIFTEANYGAGVVLGMNFEDNRKFFYNPSIWDVEEAYKAFGDKLKVYTNTDFYGDLSNRIWIIDSPNADYYNEVFNNENYRLIDQFFITVKYENYDYNIILVERVVNIDGEE